MTLYLEILPVGQREFWDRAITDVPRHFVLYGGTAVSLRCGHRTSVDFDFFSHRPLDEPALRAAVPVIDGGTVLTKGPNTLVTSVPIGGEPVKLSFFGDIGFGRVGDPDRPPGGPAIASPLDLLATKLKALHDRIEAKDYLDIEVLLRSGLDLTQGLAAARALFGNQLNPIDTAKAVSWFKDGGLEGTLTATTRAYLEKSAAKANPTVVPLAIRSQFLSETQ